MAEVEKNGLDDLLLEYNERKQKESEKEELKQSEENALRDKTIESITKTIIPILEKFKKKIIANGHYAEIEKKLEIRIKPYVNFSFTPGELIPPSNISFIYFGAGKINIERDINTAYGGQSGVGERQIVVGEVTEQWVNDNLEFFIRAVLKAN